MDTSKSTSWAEVRLCAVGVAYCRRSPPPVAGLATHSSRRRRQGPQPGEVGRRSPGQRWGLKLASFRRMAAGRKGGEVSAPPRGFSVDGPVLAGQGFLGNRKVGAVQTPPPNLPQVPRRSWECTSLSRNFQSWPLAETRPEGSLSTRQF